MKLCIKEQNLIENIFFCFGKKGKIFFQLQKKKKMSKKIFTELKFVTQKLNLHSKINFLFNEIKY